MHTQNLVEMEADAKSLRTQVKVEKDVLFTDDHHQLH